MKGVSAVAVGPERVDVREFDLPDVGERDALLKIELGGVCGSDPKAYRGEHHRDPLPAILGHEILGRIHRIGDVAERRLGVEAGDRVIVEAYRRCGSCEYCLDGRYQFCARDGTYGLTSVEKPPGLWGAHGEYMYLTTNSVVHPIAESIPAEAAVLITAVVGNSVRWLEAAESQFERSLVIQGPGPQGLSMTIVAAKMGFSPIVVAGLPGDEDRLEMARALGADHTVCEPPELLVESVREVLGGQAEVVVNLTGVAQTVQDSIAIVGTNGTVIYPNVTDDCTESRVNFNDLVYKNARLVGVLSSTAPDIERAIGLVERDPDPFARLLSHTYPVEEAERAYRAVGRMDDGPVPRKVAIDPSL